MVFSILVGFRVCGVIVVLVLEFDGEESEGDEVR